LVGVHEDDGLCALVRYRCDPPDAAYIQLLGVALANQGKRCGRDAMETVLDEIRADPVLDTGEDLFVSCLVDKRNEPSKRLIRHFDFRHTVDWDDQYEEWATFLPAVDQRF
jgi:ribosomal protein S18 acetylase RimI-like enzyme